MSSSVPKIVMHYGAALGQLSPCRRTFVTAHSVNATHDIKKVTCGQCLRIVNPSKSAAKVAGSRTLPVNPAICEIRRVKSAVLRAQLDDEQFHLIANAVVELEHARRCIVELDARAVAAEARASLVETERDDARRELDPDAVTEPPPVLGDLAPGNADRARALNACRLADGRTWLDAVIEAAEEEHVDLESVIEGAANISAQRARWKAWCTIRLLTSAETTCNDIGALFGVTGRQVSSKLIRLSDERTSPVVPHAPRPALVSRRTKVEGEVQLEPELSLPTHTIPKETRDVVLERNCYRDVVLERELVRRFREGDDLAGAKLAEMHRPLFRTVVKSFQNKGVDVEDLEQESLIGFLHGVKKFDADRGVRLTTYSIWWVRHFVSRYVKNNRSTIRVPIYVQESKKASAEAQRAAAAVHYHMSSLDEPAGDESSETLQDRLASERAGPDGGLLERTTQKRRRELIDTALQQMPLTQVQREIVQRRLLCEEPETLQSVADIFGISRERVRQIETEIMERFRREIGRLLEKGELQTLLTG